MKSISLPTEKPWWVGLRLQCDGCNGVFELELKDEPKTEHRQGRDVSFTCCYCPRAVRVSVGQDGLLLPASNAKIVNADECAARVRECVMKRHKRLLVPVTADVRKMIPDPFDLPDIGNRSL